MIPDSLYLRNVVNLFLTYSRAQVHMNLLCHAVRRVQECVCVCV